MEEILFAERVLMVRLERKKKKEDASCGIIR